MFDKIKNTRKEWKILNAIQTMQDITLGMFISGENEKANELIKGADILIKHIDKKHKNNTPNK